MARPEPTFYRTVEDADAYFANLLYTTDWTNGDAASKLKAQKDASRAIDRIAYVGEKSSLYEARVASSTVLTDAEVQAAEKLQRRQWPRDDDAAAESFTLTIDATGGDFTLTFNGETTGAIAFDADAATIQAALVALASVTAGDVLVTDNLAGTGFGVTVAGTIIAQRYNTLVSTSTGLTGGALSRPTILILVDNVPDEIAWAVYEEALSLLEGRIADMEFRNLPIVSDGLGGARVSKDRSTTPVHAANLITSPTAWSYILTYLDFGNDSFEIERA